ncbi:MAG TPA: sugar transferase [Gaiellaceae bacterium]|nr:sugar transferase [Gaiellaceae bacterium]
MSTLVSDLAPELDVAHDGGHVLPRPHDFQRLSSRVARERGWLVRRALVAAEGLALVLSYGLADVIVHGAGQLGQAGFWRSLPLALLVLPLWIVAAKVAGLYDRDIRFASYSSTEDVAPVFGVATLGALVALFAWHLAGAEPSWGQIGVCWLTVIPAVTIGRATARALVWRSHAFRQNTVIVGAGDVGRAVAQKFSRHPETGIDVIGFVDSDLEPMLDIDGLPLLGTTHELPLFARELGVQRVVIAFSSDHHEQVLDLVRELRELGVHVDIVPRLLDVVGPGTEVHDIEGMPLVGLATLRLSRSSLIVKRTLDLTLASLILLLLLPVFLVVAAAIALDSRGPVFFRQTRMGYRNQPFRLFKFRTMVKDADLRKHEFAHLNRHAAEGGDARMFKICNDPRVTRVGRVLRKYFLDELPQLINVLRGEMSLIGPRPLIPEEAAFVESWGNRRLDLKPGMTGSWQVLGRSAISFEEMVKLDYWYVTTWSLGRDLRLLLRTVPLVLRGEAPV